MNKFLISFYSFAEGYDVFDAIELEVLSDIVDREGRYFYFADGVWETD
jgi:hypothetical protein